MTLPVAARRPATILVVDDHDSNQYAVVRALAASGFNTVEVATGHEALRRAAGVDLVVLDVRRPDIDGLEVCRSLRANPATAAIPVIHLSAPLTSASARAEGLSTGADACLTHPFEQAELVALINALLRARDAEAQRLHAATGELEDRYRVMFEQAPLPMWIVEAETWRCLAVNQAVVDQYGYTREDWLEGRTHQSGFPCVPEDASHADGRAASRTCTHTRRDGSKLDVEVIANAVRFEGRPAWLVTGKDVTDQRRAREAVLAGEQRMRAQFMTAPVPAYAWRVCGDDFELVDFNAAALDLTRGLIRERLGIRATEMFRGAPSIVESMRESLRTGRRLVQDLSYTLHTTGEHKEFAVTYAPVPPDTLFVHTVDETERRGAEAAVRASEQRFRALTEHATELVAIVNADATFQYASPGYESILGYPPSELVGETALNLVHPDDIAPTAAALARLADRPGEVTVLLVRVRHRDGSYRAIEFRGESRLADPAVRGIVCNGRDVTERRLASEELRFRASLLDAVEQAVIATTLDGTITYWSRYAERMYGWSEHEVRGRRIMEVLPYDVSPARSEELLRRIAAGESWCEEFEMPARDGRRVIAEVTDSPIFDAAGTIVGIVGVAVDISDRRAMADQLRQAQKLEAVGKLAGGVAHDFNNLLTVIRGSNEFVSEVLPTDSPARVDVEEIAAAVDRAEGLTRQLLAFSRKQVLTPRLLDLNAVVHDVKRMLGRLIGEDITLSTFLDDSAGAVLADRGQIEQVLVNLVVNARDAMPGGGQLVITTGASALEESLRRRHGEDGERRYVLLSVRDTGHGMDRATLEHAFEPFFTTKAVGSGTGLGLATVYGIVRQSGGHITAHSEPGAGAEFRIYLPRREPVGAGGGGAPLAADPRGEGCILLVEDEEAVRRVARRVLERMGYSVLEASNGRVALERFREAPDAIDLVVTDTVMPEMGGRELVEELRRQRAGLPALYMSGYTDDEIVRRGVDPSTSFLQKPFTAESFDAALRDMLDRTPRGDGDGPGAGAGPTGGISPAGVPH